MGEMEDLIDVLKTINNNIALLTLSNLTIAEELNKLRHEEANGTGSDWTLNEIAESWYGIEERTLEPEFL